MGYVLISEDGRRVSATNYLFDRAIPVDVCSEDGTVHNSRFLCPTCYLKREDD